MTYCVSVERKRVCRAAAAAVPTPRGADKRRYAHHADILWKESNQRYHSRVPRIAPVNASTCERFSVQCETIA